MLDDNNRRRLREIERRLCAEDPGLARRFETAPAPGGRPHGPTGREAEARPFSQLIIVVLVLLGLSLLITPPAASALLFIAALCLLTARWMCAQAER